MSYNLTKQLPSCAVERRLLLELESYVQRKIAEHAPPFEGVNSIVDNSFTIADKVGIEILKSVEEYQRSYFPDDTKIISIEARSIGKNSLSIEIQFTPSKSNSEVRVRFSGNSAREVATGIAAEILSIMESYKTLNYLFHYLYGLPLGILVYTMIYVGMIYAGLRPSRLDALSYFLVSIMSGVAGAVIGITFNEKFKPYSTFETRRNERRKKQFSWIVLGVLGFILFTVIGVFLRQKLLGF